MTSREVLMVTLLALGLSLVHGTPLTGEQEAKDCVVHPLSSEVVEQLVADTNATLTQVQDVKLLLGGYFDNTNWVDSSISPEVAHGDISKELVLMLLRNMQEEQKRQSERVEQLSVQVAAVSRREEAGRSREEVAIHQSTSISESLLSTLQQLQQEIQQLKPSHDHSTITDDNTQQQARVYKWDNCNNNRARDCHDLLLAGNNQSGVYQIFPHRCGQSDVGVQVWCELEGKDSGWTVVLARRPLEEQINFNRGWRAYREGFGDPNTEHWVGNAVLHYLTMGRPQVMRVDMMDWDGAQRYAEYHSFMVEDEDSDYRLHLGQFSGDAGDAMITHDNMRFSTNDKDNDNHGTNCARNYHGGFWYNGCHAASPTSLLLEKQKSTSGINWSSWYSDRTTLKEITFKLKPKACRSY